MEQIFEVHFAVVDALRSIIVVMIEVVIGNVFNSFQLLIGNIIQAMREAFLLAHALMGNCMLSQTLENVINY